MRTVIVLALVCTCLIATTGRWLGTITALPDEHQVSSGAAVAPALPTRARAPCGISIGSLDTIGGTTYDWQTSGPVWRTIVDSRRYGVHAVWMYSAYTSGSDFPDRNMRYNFFDSGWGQWNWTDPDYMQSGVNVLPWRAGYGNVDVDTSGVAVISAHYSPGGEIEPIVARDADVGAGIFDYSELNQGQFEWPCIGVGADNYYHLAMVDYATQDELFWTRSTNQGVGWETPLSIASPGFPTHNVAASKAPGSQKIGVTWVVPPVSVYGQQPGFYRESSDGGDTWGSPVDIGFPPAFHPGSDSVPSFHISSLFPFYDNDDRLNIVAGVVPVVNDTNFIIPSEVWHYCPDNTPQWNRIHRAGCDPANLQASVGYNAAYACRPSIGQDEYGDLFVAWEQFDSANVEARTSRLRADIWTAGSTDGGLTWSAALKLTTADSTSCRFPSICDLLWPGDSLAVLYDVDQCAGFFVMGEGPGTCNPIVVQKVPVDSIIQRGPYFGRLKQPNGGESLYAGGSFAIRWKAAPQTFDRGVLSLSTDGGSTFPTVLAESIPPGESTYIWDPIPLLCCSLCRVKFEAKDTLGATVFSDVSYRNFKIDSVFTDVSESRPEPGTAARPAPTVIRGVLFLPEAASFRPASLMDATGRKVMELAPGANDVRALAPGVYFVRAVSRELSAVGCSKVVITR